MSEADKPTCAADDRQELATVGSDRQTETNFYRATQLVTNQGLYIAVMSVGDYIKEDWFASRRFATFPEPGALLPVTNARGRSIFTRLGASEESCNHVGKIACDQGGFVLLSTVGTVDDVYEPWLRLREDFGYQKALHVLIAASRTHEDEDPSP